MLGEILIPILCQTKRKKHVYIITRENICMQVINNCFRNCNGHVKLVAISEMDVPDLQAATTPVSHNLNTIENVVLQTEIFCKNLQGKR